MLCPTGKWGKAITNEMMINFQASLETYLPNCSGAGRRGNFQDAYFPLRRSCVANRPASPTQSNTGYKYGQHGKKWLRWLHRKFAGLYWSAQCALRSRNHHETGSAGLVKLFPDFSNGTGKCCCKICEL